MYDISLSIVTYNNEDIIEKTIASIIAHLENKLNYILYVIDNNSTDDTVKRVMSCLGNIVLIRNNKNMGFGAGHNTVLDKLDSRYHIVVNPDITIVNDAIVDIFRYMEDHEDIGLLTPLIKHPDVFESL